MKKNAVSAPEKKAVRIQSLDQLQALVDQPVIARFQIDDQDIELECQRLSPQVAEKVREIERSVLPPYRKDRNDHDYMDPVFVKNRAEAKDKARSYLIYARCPAVASKKPGMTDVAEIHGFVRGILSETLLEVIALTITAEGLNVKERVNFTSPGNSES